MERVIAQSQADIQLFIQNNDPSDNLSIMNVIHFIIKFLQARTGTVQRVFNEIWKIDQRNDTFRYLSIKELTRTDIDKIKNIRIMQNVPQQVFYPDIQRVNNQPYVQDKPRSIFNVAYIDPQLQYEAYDEQNIQQYRNIAQMFRYLFRDDYMHMINLSIRQELNAFSEGLDECRDQLEQAQSVTVANLLQYAQICDFDFTKGCVLAMSIKTIIHLFQLNDLEDMFDRNQIYITIKIIQYMNSRIENKLQIHQIAMPQDEFNMLSQAEFDLFSTKFARQHSMLIDNIITGTRVQYIFRPQFSKIYECPFVLNHEVIYRGNLNQNQSDSIRDIIQVYRQVGQGSRLTGIHGNVIDVIAYRIKTHVMKYENMDNILNCIFTLFIGITIQIPIGVLNQEFIKYNNRDKDLDLVQRNNENINRLHNQILQGRIGAAIDEIKRDQIDEIKGLSEYYTVNIQMDVDIQGVNQEDNLKRLIGNQLQYQIEQLVAQYSAFEECDIRVAPILACMQDAVIRKITIRSFLRFQNPVEQQQREIAQRVAFVQPRADRSLYELLDMHLRLHDRSTAPFELLMDVFNDDEQLVNYVMYDQQNVTDAQIAAMTVQQKQYLSTRDQQRLQEYNRRQEIFSGFSADLIDRINRDQDLITDEELLRMNDDQINELYITTRWRAQELQNQAQEGVDDMMGVIDNYYYGMQNPYKRRKFDENDDNFGAVYSRIDYINHKKYGYEEDMKINCIEAVNNRLMQLYNIQFLLRNIIDVQNFKDMIEQDGRYDISFVRYSTNGLLDDADIAKQTIIYIGYKHIFVGNIQRYLGCRFTQQNDEKDMILYKVHDVEKKCYKNMIINKHMLSAGVYFADRCRANVYFDFETTFDDQTQRFMRTGFKSQLATSVRDQIDFAVSIVADVKFRLEDVLNGMRQDAGLSIVSMPELNIIMNDVKTFWEIPASAALLRFLQDLESTLNQAIKLFNEAIKGMPTRDDIQIFNQIQCFSFNGAKFDNHFVLSQIKQIEGKQWIDHVTIIGTQADMKSMSYKSYTFLDMRLMTGAGSLKKFCQDMNIDVNDAKKDIDMNKMKTLTLCEQNKDEIMLYVANDSIALHKIHKKFMKAMRTIVSDYVVQSIGDGKRSNMIIPDLLESKLGEEQNFGDVLSRCLKGQFSKWMTISGISRRIFTDFFCKFVLRSASEESIFNMMQKSYQGGYTQAFWIGNKRKDDKIIYLDYNSMYPAIMANLVAPCDLSKCEIINEEDRQMTRITAWRLFNLYVDIDPLNIKRGRYSMTECFNNYSLFELSQFKFAQDTVAPSFGIKTQKSGTVYPLEYDVRRDSDIGQMPVVFGFQLVEAFRNCNLEYACVRRRLRFNQEQVRFNAIFKNFDEYMYEARSMYKKQKNASMAQCIKLFINSLYGKFGEKHHDIEFHMDADKFADNDVFGQIVREKLLQHPNTVDDCLQHLNKLRITNTPLFDLNNRDEGLIRVKISNAPFVNNHIGAFVYYASLITAVGRTQITSIINRIYNKNDNNCLVYYADTDSLIMNAQAAKIAKQFVTIDDNKLGAMKNEYPIKGDADYLSSQIEDLIVINKKIYQYKIDGMWINKFKGCASARDDMFQQFTSGQGFYTQAQTRFKKRNGNVTIIDLQMNYKLRMSRQIVDIGMNVATKPFDNVYIHQSYYKQTDAQLVFSQQRNAWIVHIPQ